MGIADQSGDLREAHPTFVAVQLIQATIKAGHRGFELLSGCEMKSVGVTFWQFAIQELEVCAPLLRRQLKNFLGLAGVNRMHSEDEQRREKRTERPLWHRWNIPRGGSAREIKHDGNSLGDYLELTLSGVAVAKCDFRAREHETQVQNSFDRWRVVLGK
ncbi:MAG TPA: hypothetical protein VFO34_00805 [Candidatus Acidoferrales bacterium]|nr:hypothetical protein [Candidatus Acidoferrales bacterium]